MRALITGAGRGGTNLLREYVKITDIFNFEDCNEDRTFFERVLPEKYATKLSTENSGFFIENIYRMMEDYPDLIVFFAIRHPIDCCLSKIYRGQPSSKGGDGEDRLAPDATFEGSIYAVEHMYDILNFLKARYPNRLFIFRMEEIIKRPELACAKICQILCIDLNENMVTAYKNNRNKYHQKRYDKLDKTQIKLYKRIGSIYDGYFRENETIVQELYNELEFIIKELNYEDLTCSSL